VETLTELSSKQEKMLKQVIDIKKRFRDEHNNPGLFSRHVTIASEYLTELDKALTF